MRKNQNFIKNYQNTTSNTDLPHITHPKIREVWAADFRDLVMHHLVYNAISEKFYKRFIRDNYACIPSRGTHDGMHRARLITNEWTRPAYFLNAGFGD